MKRLLGLALVATVWISAGTALAAAPERIRGIVSAVSADMVTVQTATGGSVSISLSPDTKYLTVVHSDLNDISAGGYIGQNLAMGHPGRVRSLILFGSTPGLRNSQAATWIPRIARDGIRKFLMDTIEDRFVPGTDPRKIAWFVACATQCDPAYVGRFVGLMSSLDWSDRLGEIKCPTLLVIPGAETVGSIKNYDVMRERIADVQLIAYEGLPHNIGEAVPERCAEDVLAFLRWRFGMPSPALHTAKPH